MAKTTPKSILGAEKKAERAKVQQIRAALRGKTIKTLNANDRDDLLIVLCVMLGLTDKDGMIK
jgi:hypothetical protein